MNLFEYSANKSLERLAPLADRIRPTTLDEYIGQTHIVSPSKLLYRAIKADKLSSIILYGPPGTGKTTLAKIIANTTKMNFKQLNAVTSGIKDIREVTSEAKEHLGMYNTRTILFIDEIHRFNKSQQDALLPFVENGTIILIGATTENPYFEVNKALISRSMIFKLELLDDNDIERIILNALADKDKGLGNFNVDINKDALEHLINISNGDARTALNSIELAVLTTDPDDNGKIHISVQIIEECVQQRALNYEKNGDEHFNTVSAFIKSMRGSDPDATLYWLAKMIYAGEDPKFIARRIIISASEDIGNADPNALSVATSAFEAINFIGMPEGRIVLAQAALYMATAPKSNSAYVGIDKAINDIKNIKTGDIPTHLKDSHYSGAKNFGHGKDYLYPHSYKDGFVKQQYLPDNLKGTKYYEPTENGYEKEIKERLDKLK